MKNKWLNLVLSLTNKIYFQKQMVLETTGMGIVVNVFNLIFLELTLAIVSLPLYLGIRHSKTVAFLEEKGSFVKIVADYNMRRVLTLTGVGILAIIWFLKFILIVGTPAVYGPLQLYSISGLSPSDVPIEELEISGTQIETSRIIESMPIPKLDKVRKERGRDYVFSGRGDPSLKIVLLLSREQTVIYSDEIDDDGTWEIEHSQDEFKLSQGNHSVLVFSYDEEQKARSKFSTEQFFKVRTTLLDKIISNFDVLSNWIVIILIVVGIFLTILVI